MSQGFGWMMQPHRGWNTTSRETLGQNPPAQLLLDPRLSHTTGDHKCLSF